MFSQRKSEIEMQCEENVADTWINDAIKYGEEKTFFLYSLKLYVKWTEISRIVSCKRQINSISVPYLISTKKSFYIN